MNSSVCKILKQADSPQSSAVAWLRLSLFASVIAIAAFLRLAWLNSIPPGFSPHSHVLVRSRFYHYLFELPWSVETWRTICSLVIEDQHGPQSLLEAAITPLFGMGMLESRLLVASVSIATIAISVFAGMTMGGWALGLSLGFILAISAPHITFSRYGDTEHINFYLQGLPTLLFASLFCKRPRMTTSLALGLFLGLSIYIYAVAQFMTPLVLVAMICAVIFGRHRTTSLIKYGFYLSLVIIVMTLLIWPQVEYYLSRGRLIPIRSPYSDGLYAMTSMQSLPTKFKTALEQLFIQVKDPWFGWRGGALMDCSLMLVIPGLLWLWLELRRWSFAGSFVFLGLLTGMLPAIMSPEVPFRRMLILILSLDFLKAGGVVISWQAIKRQPWRSINQLIVFCFLLFCVYRASNSLIYHLAPSDSGSNRASKAIVDRIRSEGPQRKIGVFVPEIIEGGFDNTLAYFIWMNVTLPSDRTPRIALPPHVTFISEKSIEDFVNQEDWLLLVHEGYSRMFEAIKPQIQDKLSQTPEIRHSDQRGFLFLSIEKQSNSS